MRNAQKNSRILLAAALILSVGILWKAASLLAEIESGSVSPLAYVIGSSEYAIGNDYGEVYAVNGEKITTEYEGKRVSSSGYTNVIGSRSGGLIYRCRSVLLSNNAEVNRMERQGNHIITTLHPTAQQTAVKMLAEYDVEQIEASITVVLHDGAVAVAAGNNSYDENAFADPERKALYRDFSSEAEKKGSCWKPIVYCMLLQNADLLPEDMDLYSENFQDVSSVEISGNTIHNWDWSIPVYYEADQNGILTRECSLSELLMTSSNTAPVRCAQKIGFSNAYEQLLGMFALDRPIVTEINTLTGIDVPESRLPWLFFGQDASVSPVRMCQLYNHLVSGEFYSPFYVAAVTQPDGNVIYQAAPTEKIEYHMEIDVENSMLNNALEDTFAFYTTSLQGKYPDSILNSRRLLAKSGTAENADGTENRTIMLTVLNEGRTEVICSACICLNHVTENIKSAALIDKLLQVLMTMDIL